MATKSITSTHEALIKTIGPINEEIARVVHQLEKLRGEHAILRALSHAELEKAGLSANAIDRFTAACW